MKLNKSRSLPADLLHAAKRLDDWRQQRVKGERIPEPLWKLVLAAARRYGVNRTATSVRVGYYELKKRLAAASAPASAAAATSAAAAPRPMALPPFVELPLPTATSSAAPTAAASECRLEWEQPAGTKVRLQWTGSPPDLLALLRGLREVE